jgi:hypothetical protein
MKLSDAMKVIAKKKEQQTVDPVVETVDTALPGKGKRGKHDSIISVMGIPADSEEYEEVSRNLERLSRANPALYRKMISLD